MRRRAALVTALALLATLLAIYALFPRGDQPPDAARTPDAAPDPAAASRTAREAATADATAAEDSDANEDPAPAPGTSDWLTAEDLTHHPATHAICAVDPPLLAARGHLLVGDADQDPPYNGRLVRVIAGQAFLPRLEAELGGDVGRGWLAVEGYAPTRIRWVPYVGDGPTSCTPDPIELAPAEVSVSGTVRNAEGEPAGRVFVEGCANQAWTDEEGAYVLDARPGRCALQAYRRDGVWVAKSDAVDLTLVAGEDRVVDFALPPIRTGGIGIAVRAVDDGIHVDRVLPGGGAEAAGLAPGDLVVEIDGQPTVEMDLQEFVDQAVGDEGTDVQLLLDRGGVGLTVSVQRRGLDRDDG